jgi:hypothetical protein
MTPKQARHQMRACIANARKSLDQLEYQVNSDEAFIGSQARAFANDIVAWMFHLTSHSAHADKIEDSYNEPRKRCGPLGL